MVPVEAGEAAVADVAAPDGAWGEGSLSGSKGAAVAASGGAGCLGAAFAACGGCTAPDAFSDAGVAAGPTGVAMGRMPVDALAMLNAAVAAVAPVVAACDGAGVAAAEELPGCGGAGTPFDADEEVPEELPFAAGEEVGTAGGAFTAASLVSLL